MRDSNASPRLAWLVNLFGDPAEQHAHAAAVLRATAARLGAHVAPVYCLSQGAPELASLPEGERADAARSALSALLETYHLPAAPPIVLELDDPDPSLRERVDGLAARLRDEPLLFAVVHTHSYSTLDRLFIGSFSERFFTRAPLPVLVLNPHVTNPDTYDRITFATDLSDESREAFSRLLPIARGLSAAVSIEHQIRVSELGVFMSGTGSREQYQRELAESRLRAEASAAELRVQAEEAGVRATVTIHQQSASESDGQGYEERAADGDVPMLAISAHSEQPWPASIGSTARWLMRHAQRPVLVLPPASTA
jgi:nucleotide-binding universal stress UspA family protein